MAQLIPILMQLIGGAVGGNAAGAAVKKLDLSVVLKTILGLIGGVGGGQLAALIPVLQGLLEQSGTGGAIAGNAGAGAVGGALLTLIGGMIKQAMNKSKA